MMVFLFRVRGVLQIVSKEPAMIGYIIFRVALILDLVGR